MKVRTGDNVKIMAGKDKGKTGKIIQTFPDKDLVVVEGINTRHRHLRPERRGEKGQKISFSAPLHASNIRVICGKCGKAARIGSKRLADGKKVRVCVKCKETI